MKIILEISILLKFQIKIFTRNFLFDMTIQINDELKTVADTATVSTVVFDVLALDPSGMAIAINDAIVPRRQWDSTPLQPNDKMLVIKASKGG